MLGFTGGVDHGADDNFHRQIDHVPDHRRRQPQRPLLSTSPAPNGGAGQPRQLPPTLLPPPSGRRPSSCRCSRPTGSTSSKPATHTRSTSGRPGLSPITPVVAVVQRRLRGGRPGLGRRRCVRHRPRVNKIAYTGIGQRRPTSQTRSRPGSSRPTTKATTAAGNARSGYSPWRSPTARTRWRCISSNRPTPSANGLHDHHRQRADRPHRASTSTLLPAGSARPVELTVPCDGHQRHWRHCARSTNQTNEYAILSGLQLVSRTAVPFQPDRQHRLSPPTTASTWISFRHQRRRRTNTGNGSFSWTPTTTTAGSTGLIRVTEGTSVVGVSDQPLLGRQRRDRFLRQRRVPPPAIR